MEGSLENSEFQRRYDRQLTNGVCPHCGCDDESMVHLVPIDNGDLVIKECSNCNKCFGMDDFVDPAELLNSLEKDGITMTTLSPCTGCGNSDVHKFVLHQHTSDDGHGLFKCCMCGTVNEITLIHNIGMKEDISLASQVSLDSPISEEKGWGQRAIFEEQESVDCSSGYESDLDQQYDSGNLQSWTSPSMLYGSEYRWDEHGGGVHGHVEYEERWDEHVEKVHNHYTGYVSKVKLQCKTCKNPCPDLISQIPGDGDDLYYCHECSTPFQVPNESPYDFLEHEAQWTRASSDDESFFPEDFHVEHEVQHGRPQQGNSSCIYRRCNTELIPQVGRPGRRRVTNIHIIAPGDHIMWHRNYAAYHHAIVESVDDRKNQIKILEYSGTVHRINGHFASIQSNTITFNSGGDMMYVVDYDNGCSYPNEETLRRARTRLGETRYNLITNNCEHFATWCKTGREDSQQTKTFTKRLLRTAITSGLKSVGELLTAGVVSASKAIPLRDSLKIAKDVGMKHANNYGEGVSKFVRNVKGGALILGLTTNLAAEGVSFAVYTDEAHQQYLDGKTSREDFERRRMKLGCEAIGGFVGGVLGGIAGQFAIPIPMVGALVGSTLGSILGRYIGALIGKKISDKCWKTM